ncbi:phosphoadenosine phosphosulfate reductase family protein [Heliophilum fasciatum]|uniref:Phosphoadenosine phosphosulfate reductase family protein n=1 Tax=Heliophilum fasciatum TaxID=35700 RepID=A0A4R2RAU1_9FIRM|nr:phosphoadenosine phosphosulfate reductase family protein [Heliophilum fasciatum]MCW2279319.1 3'-phosphoadenosine 5'-phosphosulfate sulfotransferase (PAPS reductase)/FAD synthetase/ferredoxin [Heliophilum fasciatum]TCP60420.1 phosphoadenosine phosphosulfate reductase family protein [Heliophilum fasciatum]
MYYYKWDKTTGGYLLTTQTGKFVANEIRPVFALELSLTGLGKRFTYDPNETRPLLWAQKNVYLVNGEKVAQLNNTRYGSPLSPEFFFEGKLKLEPVDIAAMVDRNAETMDIVVADAKRRTKELYDADIGCCDVAYIAFSGGKDSVALLDVCHRVLPLSVPVIFSDTDMELPDTYKVWEEIQARYPERGFIKAAAESSALENWRRFAPPSRKIRWCCSVHKSTPALMLLKRKLNKTAIKVMAFTGVRADESLTRSSNSEGNKASNLNAGRKGVPDDMALGAKNASQINVMPILDWSAHELWLYIFANDLLINCAYKKGLQRVGCLMCPESSERYSWFVDKAYPHLLKPYKDIILETSAKTFVTAKEKTEFIGKRFWQARGSGLVLKESITKPLENIEGLTVTFQSPNFSKDLFYEWIKTLGTVVKESGTGHKRLKLPNTLDKGIPFAYTAPYTGGGTARFEFRDNAEKNTMLPILRSFLRKVSACVNCHSCEAECALGAISNHNGKLKIDNSKCTKCRKCYDIESNCWRYRSMNKPESTKNPYNEIGAYKNFGMREEWIPCFVEFADKGDNFFLWNDNHPLGSDMVNYAAPKWFAQANLIVKDDKKPTLLLDVFRKYGSNYPLAWEFVWIALANNAMIIKWFIVTTQIDVMVEPTSLLEKLNEIIPWNNNAKDRRLDSLKNTLISTPLAGDDGIALCETKGKQVKSITRKAKDVNPLTVLYGLYLIAQKAERSSFTIRELLTADIDSNFVSPIVAFGISAETFKLQCQGLASKYPNYISCTFTHGLDELTVFPQKYGTDDIIALALGE